LLLSGDARYFLLEAYKHLKAIGLSGDARRFKAQFNVQDNEVEEGLVEDVKAEGTFMADFLSVMASHRVWSRSKKALTVAA